MSQWNPKDSLQSALQRTQPSKDPAACVLQSMPETPLHILDPGCGPGNSTAVLKECFPKAEITGIDRSTEMIEQARQALPMVKFDVMDVRESVQSDEMNDLIFSNACLQWVPDHETLLPALMEHVCEGGLLAVQIPDNGRSRPVRLQEQELAGPRWKIRPVQEQNAILRPSDYHDLLCPLFEFDLWQTTYYHALPTAHSVVSWFESARYLSAFAQLDSRTAGALRSRPAKLVSQETALQTQSGILLPMRRLFFLARKVSSCGESVRVESE